MITWLSPGCNGGPVHSALIALNETGVNSTSRTFELNNTNLMWNATSGVGSVIISEFSFELNMIYNWSVTVKYNATGGGTVWSQESAIVSTNIRGMFLLNSIKFYYL